MPSLSSLYRGLLLFFEFFGFGQLKANFLSSDVCSLINPIVLGVKHSKDRVAKSGLNVI